MDGRIQNNKKKRGGKKWWNGVKKQAKSIPTN
jgi:hypothetical protein